MDRQVNEISERGTELRIGIPRVLYCRFVLVVAVSGPNCQLFKQGPLQPGGTLLT